MIEWLKEEWINLTSRYCKDISLRNEFWDEIRSCYSEKSRYYHNLKHIYNILLQADEMKSKIEDFDALKLAIWYHDIIYKPSKKNNEEKSSLFAKNRLNSLNFDEKRAKIVQNFIVSTKKHQLILSETDDNAYFLDFDLSILGTDWETYKNYYQNIRKEYKIYPDFLYNPNRKKILNHFLERETLYFTEVYQVKYELQARANLKKEITLL
ncbi:MAG: hypothetical protein R2816_08955 [Flavobacteriaceae bacterium]